jgi:hypothetical protein
VFHVRYELNFYILFRLNQSSKVQKTHTNLTSKIGILNKLIFAQIVKKSPTFLELKGSLSCSHELTTRPCSELHEYVSHRLSVRQF